MSERSDARRVPGNAGRGEVREMASRFIGLALRVRSPQEAAEALERLRSEHHDATHVAFAWRVGAGPDPGVRVSDDGEPAGTAGKPILAAIES